MSYIINMNRRLFLKGAGALIALPSFESVKEVGDLSFPTRFCFFYFPNGASMEHWRPREIGPLNRSHLPTILEPLAAHLDYVTVVGGLDNRACEKGGAPEALGQHARSIAAFLSGTYPSRDLHAGETIDVALARSRRGARIPLLNLATEYAEEENDFGYSPVYNYSLSWKDDRTPIQPIESPRYAFELLCGDATARDEVEAGLQERVRAKRSVLDSVLEAGRSLQSQLNSGDRRVLEEYLESIRSIEREMDSAAVYAPAACPAGAVPNADPSSFEDRLKIMLDIVCLALRTRSTHVATLLFGAERSERDFGFLSGWAGFDMAGGHHSISHHKNNTRQLRKYTQIGLFHAKHFASFLQKLKETKEGEGNLLDHTLIVYGSSMSDGNTHEHYNLPILIAGKGNGLVEPGKLGTHINYGGKPISNLYLTLLRKMSVADLSGSVYTSFGDSGGTIELPGGY